MEKLKNLRKQRGYTQDYMSKILSTDVSNYCRKENGEVRIYEDMKQFFITPQQPQSPPPPASNNDNPQA